MIKRELIDLINKNQIWAFVGSGPSIDSGLPSWHNLLESCIKDIGLERDIKSNSEYQYALSIKDYPGCFSFIEKLSSREILESKVKNILRVHGSISPVLKSIVRMPFKGYITTNYDNLIELALLEAGIGGFSRVGNNKDDINLTKSMPEKIIWHIHGSIELPSSDLILTEKDYGFRYLDSNPLIDSLISLISQNRIIYIGYGFSDHDLNYILKKIGRYTPPTKPSYAFAYSGPNLPLIPE